MSSLAFSPFSCFELLDEVTSFDFFRWILLSVENQNGSLNCVVCIKLLKNKSFQLFYWREDSRRLTSKKSPLLIESFVVANLTCIHNTLCIHDRLLHCHSNICHLYIYTVVFSRCFSQLI